MIVKKGSARIRREFEEWLEDCLSKDVVVDLDEFPDFPGKDQVIANMFNRKQIDYADLTDIDDQEGLDRKRKLEVEKAERLRNRAREEEQVLLETINGKEQKICDESRKLTKRLEAKLLTERMRRADEC